MIWEKSCGAVVFTREQDRVKYVLVQSLKGFYGFPKGHVEAGETEQETALREVYEEVRLKPHILEGFRTTSQYMLPDQADTAKLVVFFLAEFSDQQIMAQKEELAGASLVSFKEALDLLHEDLCRVLREANDFLLG